MSFAEINEIKALKRRIEHAAGRAGDSDTEVKTGHGGIRDVEFTIQFLQLLNGGDLPEVRQRNTLLAMQALEDVGCLTDQEYRVLDDAYRFLRKIEHRLQLLFDLQTHRLPERADELRKLALRMGYAAPRRAQTPAGRRPRPTAARPRSSTTTARRPTSIARSSTTCCTRRSRSEDGQAEPESDLILDPNPDPETIQAVLGSYPFQDVQGRTRT